MECQGDVRLETAGLVLHCAQLGQVVDAVLIVLDVPVEHRRVRLQPDLVRELRRVQPLRAIDLVIADDVPYAVGEYFGAATGERIYSRLFQLQQRIAYAQLRDLRQERHLDHGERLQVYLRKALLQARAEVEKILERQVRMQPAYDVEFGYALRVPRSRGLERLVQRHRVRAGSVLLAAKRA